MRFDGEGLKLARRFVAAPEAVAIIADGDDLTYGELDRRIESRALELGPGRRLVMIQATNELEPLITYLAAVRSGHVVILVPADKPADGVVASYRPDTIVSKGETGWEISHLVEEPAHELHPELALLLSTSGSTGTSKFVRLSYDNLEANAESIAEYLQIRPDDRAATSLPLHYCYGLSVVHSHLLVGAGLILTNDSVTDPAFWTAFNAHGGTTFPAVPFTFDLLDRIDFASMQVPTLRYITQAGGRLAPERVKRYAELGTAKGFDLVVMYGATEATARMAYLPPDLAAEHPSTIGQPIPRGAFTLADDGELIYSGPNVMMGYAEEAADLAQGPTLNCLHTGDLAKQHPSGLWEIVGRKSRFLKLFGLRISLDAVESFASLSGRTTVATGTDDLLVLGTDDRRPAEELRQATAEQFGLPLSAIAVELFDEIPRLASGKVDYPAVRDTALVNRSEQENAASSSSTDGAASVATIFARTLGRDGVTDNDTFVGLGGDSLSYIEASLALEDHLGSVPDEWHLTPIGELEEIKPTKSLFRQIEMNVVLRAIAILLIVGDHFELFGLQGGAHVLLAVAGYNFSRFLLNSIIRSNSVRPAGPTIARIVVPTVGWIALTSAAKGSLDLRVLFLVSSYWTDPDGGYWFIEVLLQLLLFSALVLAVPAVRRWNVAAPYAFSVAALAGALIARFGGNAIWDTTDIGFKVPHMTLWLFAIGWVADTSTTAKQRLALTAVTLATVPGYFDSTSRTLVIIGGTLALIWVTKISVPHPTNRAIGLIGGASLYIYLVHFQVKTILGIGNAALGMVMAVLFGIVASMIAERVLREGERFLRAKVSKQLTEEPAAVS